MNRSFVKHCMVAAILVCGAVIPTAQAADLVPVVVGKNNWLFTRYEYAYVEDKPDTEATLDLLQKMHKLFERRGITLALVLVPSKVRIYADELPDNLPLNTYTIDKYDNVVKPCVPAA